MLRSLAMMVARRLLIVTLLFGVGSVLVERGYEDARAGASAQAADPLIDVVRDALTATSEETHDVPRREQEVSRKRTEASLRRWRLARHLVGTAFALSLAAFLVLRGRGPKGERDATTRLDIAGLEQLGFFRYLNDVERANAIAAATKANDAFKPETRRFYRADAEDLCEAGVRDFLGVVAPLLRCEGVPIEVTYKPVRIPSASLEVATLRITLRSGEAPRDVVEDDLDEGGTYLLYFDDEEYAIFRFEPGEAWNGWDEAARSTVRLLNLLLTEHGSPERAFGMYEGNDFCIAFVTPQMASLINAAAPARGQLRQLA